MNARKYGRSTLPGLISAPYQPELRLRDKKKAAVKSKLQGCAKCGAAHVTLRKVKEGYGRDTTEFLLCPRCYERRKHK